MLASSKHGEKLYGGISLIVINDKLGCHVTSDSMQCDLWVFQGVMHYDD